MTDNARSDLLSSLTTTTLAATTTTTTPPQYTVQDKYKKKRAEKRDKIKSNESTKKQKHVEWRGVIGTCGDGDIPQPPYTHTPTHPHTQS